MPNAHRIAAATTSRELKFIDVGAANTFDVEFTLYGLLVLLSLFFTLF